MDGFLIIAFTTITHITMDTKIVIEADIETVTAKAIEMIEEVLIIMITDQTDITIIPVMNLIMIAMVIVSKEAFLLQYAGINYI
jgi:hypothetical protein